MQNTYANQIQTGTDVYGSDAEKIGTIAGVADDYFVIEKGFIFTTDIFVPMSAVSNVSDDRVTLNVTKDQVESEDWTHQPVDDVGETHATTGAMRGDAMDAGDADDSAVLERREERLVVDKDVEQAGKVHVGKRVVEDRQSVDVPVTREEVTVNRRSVDRPAGGDTLTDDSIDVPVYEERVEAGKEARVVEELEVGKRATTDTERVEETVRREEFDIDDETGTTRQNR
jgi:uncharacterized protein (TIGR02271 family)